MFGYTSLVIAHLLASLPFHFSKIFAFCFLFSRFIGTIFTKVEKKRKTPDCVEADERLMYVMDISLLSSPNALPCYSSPSAPCSESRKTLRFCFPSRLSSSSFSLGFEKRPASSRLDNEWFNNCTELLVLGSLPHHIGWLCVLPRPFSSGSFRETSFPFGNRLVPPRTFDLV